MSDKKDNIMNDDEYQFPKDEYLSESGAATASDSVQPEETETTAEQLVGKKPSLVQRFPILKSKKFIFITLLVVIILVGFQMMHHGSDTKVLMKKKPVITTVQKPVVKSPNPSVLNELDSLKSDQATHESTIADMKSHIDQLHQQLLASQQADVQLSQSVSMLAAQVRLLTNDVKQNTKLLTVKPKKRVHLKPVYHPKPVTYAVKAIIPGRAWLMGSNDKSISVAIGNKISNYYGSVRAIDSDNGRIFTSSGKVIGYGSNDS